MKKHILVCMLMPAALGAFGQGTAADPQPVTDGDVTLPVDGTNAVTAYYSYTSSDEDRFVTLSLPSPLARVVVSASKGDKTDSDLPNVQVPDFNSSTTIVKCPAPKDQAVYFKITFPALTFDADAVSTIISVSSKPYEICYGESCSDAIEVDSEGVFLPLTAQTDPPFDMNPVYTSYTCAEDGWLYLRFQPSVTMIEYATGCESTYKRLPHEYITENGRTVGARAIMEVKKGDSYIFRVSGFNAVMMSATVENPVAGTSCDFPIDIQPGEVTLPAEAGDYYWRFTPVNESYIEITSDADLTGGRVEVMMDCNGTGSYDVFNFLHLRTHVWDRMEYLIHINKADDTAEAQMFNVVLVEPLACDDFDTAVTLEADKTYATPDFAGVYWYRVVSPGADHNFKLITLTAPEDSYTRVNLYSKDDLTTSVARGFDMDFPLMEGQVYYLKWTVFDVAHPIEFKVDYTNSLSSVHNMGTGTPAVESVAGAVILKGNDKMATITDMTGNVVCRTKVDRMKSIEVDPGIYMVQIGDLKVKVMVK